jgi:heterotetrameric sarcosine oxidase gamma subunit
MPEQAQAAPSTTAAAPVTALQITALSGRTILRLKSWLAESVTGGKPVVLAAQALPTQVGATVSESAHVLCVGPGDWLIVSEQLASCVRDRVESDLARQGLAIVELTDGLASLEVRGTGVRDLLSKGCGLDFHLRRFPAGRCTRTRFAQVPVVIECLDEPLRYQLTVARSYCRYLHAWLTDAAAELQSSPTYATR